MVCIIGHDSQRGTLLLPTVQKFIFNHFANQLDSVYSKDESTETHLSH
jgi:hypothetical protein